MMNNEAFEQMQRRKAECWADYWEWLDANIFDYGCPDIYYERTAYGLDIVNEVLDTIRSYGFKYSCTCEEIGCTDVTANAIYYFDEQFPVYGTHIIIFTRNGSVAPKEEE